MYFVLFITIALLSWAVSGLLNHRFKKYSQVYLPLTGKEVAERMLRDNGITDVVVTCTSGHLTDHYDPRNKTVNLSEGVYSSNSVAAAAVAAATVVAVVAAASPQNDEQDDDTAAAVAAE